LTPLGNVVKQNDFAINYIGSTNRRNIMNRRHILSVAAVLLSATKVLAASSEIFTGIVDGVGAGGYDPVSYLQGDEPKMGDATMGTEWKGAKWHFSSAENLAAFKANPEKYAPQYGGYCAYAVSKGSTASGDPKVFTVVDGKLYFNLSKGVQKLWQKDIPGNITAANANWPKVLE
jgi:YHS domain-containing protein